MVWALTGAETAPEPERDKRHIALWLQRRKTYGQAFHEYLARKECRTVIPQQPQLTFPQANHAATVEAWAAANPERAVCMPNTAAELRVLGHNQNNCVGGAHYRNLLQAGQCYIFAIYPVVNGKRQRAAAATFQFDLQGKLMQAEGFANSQVDNTLLADAERLMRDITFSART